MFECSCFDWSACVYIDAHTWHNVEIAHAILFRRFSHCFVCINFHCDFRCAWFNQRNYCFFFTCDFTHLKCRTHRFTNTAQRNRTLHSVFFFFLFNFKSGKSLNQIDNPKNKYGWTKERRERKKHNWFDGLVKEHTLNWII